MYRPRSPMASSKAMNFSPSPQAKRKINYIKPPEYQTSTARQNTYPTSTQELKSERKCLQPKKANLKNIEVDTNQLIQSLKTSECTNNNQTPKFCLKPDPSPHTMVPSNFFSFGDKHTQEKAKRKVKENVNMEIDKKINKVTIKKDCSIVSKTKLEIGAYDTSSRIKKTNQSFR